MITVRQILHSTPIAYEWNHDGKRLNRFLRKEDLENLIVDLESTERLKEYVGLPDGTLMLDHQRRKDLAKYLRAFI